jgi:malate dehydrogenase (oxaloacetate-decarboxylating)
VIGDDELHAEYIIPSVFNRRVVEAIAEAVGDAAVATGVARRTREVAEQDTPAGIAPPS